MTSSSQTDGTSLLTTCIAIFFESFFQPPSVIWKQAGDTIKGDAAGDRLGTFVAISGDGMTVVIGAEKSDDNGVDSGHVKIYKWDEGSSNYEPLGGTIIGDATGDNFGHSVAISIDGKTLAIGGRFNDAYGQDSGHVKVFSLVDSSWKQCGQTIIGEAAGDRLGDYVSLSADGKTLAVSGPINDGGLGYVKIYMRDEDSSNYEQFGRSIIGEAYSDFSGHMTLSGDGKTLAIGAPWNASNGEQPGHTRVYRIDDKGSEWKELGQELIGENAYDYFGWSLDLSTDGNTLAISAPLSGDDYVKESGHVRIYGLDGDKLSWEPRGQHIIGLRGDRLGESVSLSADGNTLAIGAMYNDDNGRSSGRAMVYRWDEAALDYKQLGSYITGEGADDEFGVSVALSSNGTTLVVGGWLNDENGEDSGHVKVYKIDNSTPLY